MINTISGVILAGGAGNRFDGATKSNIVIDGKTIISRIIETITNLFGEIIIVTNTPEEFIEHNNCKIISDQILKAGPLGGIHAALKASSNKAIFVFAGDMPFLDKKFIIRQIDSYNSNNCDVLIPKIGEYQEPLHSICNHTLMKPLEEYLSEAHDYAVREFFKKVNARYLQFDESEGTKKAFTNINSPSDISEIGRILGNG